MIGKRNQIITHIILWILIPIILFPVVWVVTTSLRRDEAAFSTKLFSSRISTQNYKDLLIPEKNVPVLAQELQNLIIVTPPYDQWSKDKIEKEIQKDISNLKAYMKETKDRQRNASEAFYKINDYMESKNENLKHDIIAILEDLKDYLEKRLPKEESKNEYFKLAITTIIYKRDFDKETISIFKDDLEKLFGIKISSEKDIKKVSNLLKRYYEQKIGKNERKLRELNSVISLNQEKYDKLLKEYTFLQDKVLNINNKITNDILKEILTFDKELEKIVENNHLSYVNVAYIPSMNHKITEIKQIIENISKYPDLYEVKRALENVSIKLALVKRSDYKDIDNILDNLRGLLKELDKNVKILQEKNRKVAFLKQENEFLEIEKELTQGEVEKQGENIKPSTKYGQLKIFISDLEKEIKKIESAEDFNHFLELTYPLSDKFREFATSYIIDFGRDSLIVSVEQTADRLKWLNDFKIFYEKFKLFSTNLNLVTEKTNSLIYAVDNKWKEVFEKSFKGEKSYLPELDDLYNLVKTDFVNMVSSNLNIVSKKAGELMDNIPYGEIKGYLREIDNEVFRIDQIWKQKTKHYFLRWVRNSIIVSGVASIITTLICALAAYPFSRMRFWGRRYGILTLLLIQMFPSAVYMIAIYSLLNLLGKFIPFLGLDTLSGLTFVYLGNIAYNMFLIKGYYDTIPDSLEESAMIDGATRFQTFYKIILPLARPILTVVIILTFMNVFNEFIFARIILQDAQKYTYAIGLWTFSSGPYMTEWGLFTAAALLGMLPMTILFLSLQKYIVSGLTKGAVKG
uniref:Maltose/maltodextrin transport system permease protein MalG n=1 Tax=Dictyoglomus turgidum TaxID=513050 RepID=A0A7C3WVT7_9BACT